MIRVMLFLLSLGLASCSSHSTPSDQVTPQFHCSSGYFVEIPTLDGPGMMALPNDYMIVFASPADISSKKEAYGAGEVREVMAGLIDGVYALFPNVNPF